MGSAAFSVPFCRSTSSAVFLGRWTLGRLQFPTNATNATSIDSGIKRCGNRKQKFNKFFLISTKLCPRPPEKGNCIIHLSYFCREDGVQVQVRTEGTLKTPIPKCRLYWSFLLGVVKQFCRSESGQKQGVKLLQNMVYNTTQHPRPTPQSHTLSVFTVHLVWERWGGGEVRE